MSLRCRPGDLAVFIRPATLTLVETGQQVDAIRPGTVVRVVSHNGEEWSMEDPPSFSVIFSTGAAFSGRFVGIADWYLQPLRDQPGADETLTWKPVPQPIEAA